MTIKVGINGFGRIGRMVFRAAVQDFEDIEKWEKVCAGICWVMTFCQSPLSVPDLFWTKNVDRKIWIN